MKIDFKELESFPHVKERILATWGEPEGREYILNLTIEKNRINRQGFPTEVIEIFHKLLLLHDEEFPYLVPKPSPWDMPI